MSVKIIVTGMHTEEVRQRFLSLPGADVVFVKGNNDVREEDCLDAEVFVGFILGRANR